MTRYPGWWQVDDWRAMTLVPVSWLYRLLRKLHESSYASGWRPIHRARVPVLVIGNVTVGGTGKSPLVAEISRRANARAVHVGIVSRGFGRDDDAAVSRVCAQSDPARVGDEPVMLARELGAPVYVATRRVDAVARLIDEQAPDLVLSDDGLQHYALGRDAEIAVVDASRGFGNGRLLPAGPLREPVSRLQRVDIVAVQRSPADSEDSLERTRRGVCTDAVAWGTFTLRGDRVRCLADGTETPLVSWRGREVHALAGIGHPERFFRLLETAEIIVERHPFDDHHAYTAGDLAALVDHPILVTSKDAVKLERLDVALERVYELPVRAVLDPPLSRAIDALLDELASRVQPEHSHRDAMSRRSTSIDPRRRLPAPPPYVRGRAARPFTVREFADR